MMRVLSIAPYRFLPPRNGGELYIANANAHLARYCQLTVASVKANQPATPLPYELWPLFSNSRLRYANVFYCRTLAKAIRRQNIQLIQIEHPYLGWMATLLQIFTGCPYVVHTHNIEAARFRSIGKWWWPLLQAYEKQVLRRAAHTFFISRDDADTAIRIYRLSPEKVSVSPYGISPHVPTTSRQQARAQIGAQHNIPPDTTIYYFNGALAYQPNQQAVQKLINNIDPLLNAAAGFPYVIIISGKGLPDELVQKINATNGRMIYAGYVPNLNDYLVAADVFINPVMEGGGVKTKVLEALAANKTVVSTATGAIGINMEVCGGKLQITEDNNWPQFITAMQQRNKIAEATPPAFFAYYNNDNAAREASAIMQALLARR